MGKGGGGGGDAYDREYNQNMATLANVTAGMGFNDYLRRYGYQLNPMYGGITNPMASYQLASGASSINVPSMGTQQIYGQPTPTQPSGGWGQNVEVGLDGSLTYGGGGGQLQQDPLTGAFYSPQGQPSALPQGWGSNIANTAVGGLQAAAGGVPGVVQQAGQMSPGGKGGVAGGNTGPFVQAVDRNGNPIISAIDLEDQANALNYGLAPAQQGYMLAGLQSETGLIPQRGGLESAQIQQAMGLMPQQTAMLGAGMDAARTLSEGRISAMPGQVGTVNAQNAAIQQRLAETGDPRFIAGRQAQARGEASANAMQAFNPAALRQSLGRAGTMAGSGQFRDAMAKLAFERSKAVAGGRYMAGRDTENQLRQEQMQAAGMNVSALPTY